MPLLVAINRFSLPPQIETEIETITILKTYSAKFGIDGHYLIINDLLKPQIVNRQNFYIYKTQSNPGGINKSEIDWGNKSEG